MIDPSRQQCVGLGIIRSIDPSTGKFYIITPISHDALAHVNLIIRGANYDIPSCIYLSGFEVIIINMNDIYNIEIIKINMYHFIKTCKNLYFY